MRLTHRETLVDPGDVARARSVAGRLSRSLPRPLRDDIEIVVSELASNVVKHGGGGDLLVGCRDGGFDVLALDRGPGLESPQKAFVDGYSTRRLHGGFGGIGLGAVRRLSTWSSLRSEEAFGTMVAAQLGRAAGTVASAVVPARLESTCSDDILIEETPTGIRMALLDLAGHGRRIQSFCREAMVLLGGRFRVSPSLLLRDLHHYCVVRRLTGSAVIVDLDHGGVATIVGTRDHQVLLDSAVHPLPEGTLGIAIDSRSTQVRSSMVTVASDGVDGGVHRDESVAMALAKTLWHSSGCDDISIVVAKTASV